MMIDPPRTGSEPLTAEEEAKWRGWLDDYHADDPNAEWQIRLLATLDAARAAQPSEGLPTRKDIAETLCFLAAHNAAHPDSPSCPVNRHEADRIVRALSARYDSRRALAATPSVPVVASEAGWDAAMRDPTFVASLDEGLADLRAGRTVSWASVKARLRSESRSGGDPR